MATIERFEGLDVWQRARALTNLIYDLSSEHDFARDFGLPTRCGGLPSR